MFSIRLGKWSLFVIVNLRGVEAEGSVIDTSHFEQANGSDEVKDIIQGTCVSFDLIGQSSINIRNSYAFVSFNFNLSQSKKTEKFGIFCKSLYDSIQMILFGSALVRTAIRRF